MKYNFEWNPKKAKTNKQKHKVSFQRATAIFRDPCMISIFDDEHSEDEDRWITIGTDANGILIIVSHTFQKVHQASCNVRIISARKATKKETSQYEEKNQ